MLKSILTFILSEAILIGTIYFSVYYHIRIENVMGWDRANIILASVLAVFSTLASVFYAYVDYEYPRYYKD